MVFAFLLLSHGHSFGPLAREIADGYEKEDNQVQYQEEDRSRQGVQERHGQERGQQKQLTPQIRRMRVVA
jgi:hypothetical protein